MRPIIPITDKRFEYTDAANTDIRKTFARARAGMAQQQPKPPIMFRQINQRSK